MAAAPGVNNASWGQVFLNVNPYALANMGAALGLTLCVIGAAWCVPGCVRRRASRRPPPPQIDENVAREIICHRMLRHANIVMFKEARGGALRGCAQCALCCAALPLNRTRHAARCC